MTDDRSKADKLANVPRQSDKDEVTEASEESFPASDPPSFTPLHAGTPDDETEPQKDADR